MERKVIVLVIASVIVVTVAVTMLSVVSGDNLFHIDSDFGSICVAGYRWVCLSAGIIALIWIAVGSATIVKSVRKAKEIKQLNDQLTDQ